jgi:putative ABC transport system permease protein
MPALTMLRRRLGALFTRSRIESDLEEEMRLHMELRAAQLRQDGLSAEDSRQAARRRFGSSLRLREDGLEEWGWLWLDQLHQDLRFAARTLVKSPGFALTAVLTLALGIGANTAIFSVLNGVVLKPLPYTNGERLVLVRQSAPGIGIASVGVSVREYYDYRDEARSFDALVEYHQMFFDLLRRGAPDRVNVGVVSHDFFPVLGIEPLLGRAFVAADDVRGADAVLLLSYSYWMSRFGGDPSIVGQVFEMNDRPHTVVGVLPNVPHYPQENDVYMPVASCPFRAQAEEASTRSRRAFSILSVFGRLKPGVTKEAAAREVDVICGRFTNAFRDVYGSETQFAATAPTVREELSRDAEPLLLILLGATGLVLLTACANVANLSIARLLRRDRELGLREALGAGRGRLVRQLLTESTLLSLLGGVVGLLLASSTLSLLVTFVGRFTARTGEIAVDGRVLLFTTAVSILTGVACGTAPALMARLDLGAIVRAGRQAESAGHRRLRSGLVVAQVAVSVVLLTGAGLLLTSVYKLQRVEPGYDAEQVISAEAFVTFSRYRDRSQYLNLYQSIVDQLEAEPGVRSAAITSAVPLSGLPLNTVGVRIEGSATAADARSTADVVVVSPNYFLTLGIPVRDGRVFSARDAHDAPMTVVINEALRRQWGDRPAIGSRVSFGDPRTWRAVVGVVGDVRQASLDRGARPLVYVPLAQGPALNGQILVRTTGDPAATASVITRTVHAIDPDLPVENISTLQALRANNLSRPQLTATLVTIFAALALAVTMTGITGVLALHVSHRRVEFGVRMALGASPGQILGPVLRNGLGLVALGLLLGVGAAAALTPILSLYLFATTPTDPVTFVAVVIALLATGALACLGPAWRATRVDPQLVFRTE